MRKFTALLVAVVLLGVMTVSTATAQDDQMISTIRFSNSGAVAEENLSISGYGDKDSGYAPSLLGGRVYASVSGTDLRKLEWSKGDYGELGMQPVMTGGTKNPWGNGAYLEVRVSTVGYENIVFSASLGATKKGPRDYKLQYSIDGVNYTDVAGAVFTVTTNKVMFKAFDRVTLPAVAANASLLYIRVAVSSNMMVGGTAGLIGSTGGETAINDVCISGTPLAATTVSSQATTNTTVAQTTTAPWTDTTAEVTSAVTVTESATPAGSATGSTVTTIAAISSANTGEMSRLPYLAAALMGTGILIAVTANKRKATPT